MMREISKKIPMAVVLLFNSNKPQKILRLIQPHKTVRLYFLLTYNMQ